MMLYLIAALLGIGTAQAQTIYPLPRADFVNIQQYTPCNGTADDSAAFTALFTGATGPTVIYIPAGAVCMIGDNTKNYTTQYPVSIVGAGRDVSILKYPAGTSYSTSTTKKFNWTKTGGGPAGMVRDLTIDVNNTTVPGAGVTFRHSVLYCLKCTDWRIDNVRMVNSNAGISHISIEAGSYSSITNSYFHQTASQDNGKAIWLGDTANGTPHDITISGNTIVGTNVFFDGYNNTFANNDVSGWGYGGGLSTGVTLDATKNHDNTVTGNIIHDSQAAQDNSADWVPGIENWAARTTITGNVLYRNCGYGLANGGPFAMVVGNIAYDNGQCAASGQRAGFGGMISSGNGAGGSVYASNKAYDSGGGTQLWGYLDNNASIGTATFNGNDFTGVSGDYSLNATNTSGYYWIPSLKNLYKTGAAVGNGADLTEDTLATYTVPANTLAADGDILHIRAGGTLAASTDSKTVKIKWGGVTLATLGPYTAVGNVAWSADVRVIRTGSAAESFIAMMTAQNSTAFTAASNTTTVNTTVTNDVVVTGQNTTNSVANSVKMQYLTVDVYRQTK